MERGPRGIRLTPAGVELLRAAEPLFDQLNETMRRVRLTGEGRAGTLRLGLTRSALDSRRVGRGLAALQEHFPELTVVVTEIDSGLQSEQLRTGALDLAIGIAGLADGELRSVPLCDLQIDSAILSQTHRLAGSPSIRIGQLSGEQLYITGPLDSVRGQEFLQMLRRLGVEGCEIRPTLASVLSLVAAGKGWSIAPGLSEVNAPVGTVIVPLEGFSVRLTLAARSRIDDASPLVAKVSEFLCRAMNDDLDAAPLDPSADHRRISPNLSLRQLHSLSVTAQAGSISLASQRLGMTQSGLSRQLRSLERDLGVVLLRRRLDGVQLTPAGDLLRAEAARIQALVDSALVRIATPSAGVVGRCTIGALAAEFTGDLIGEAIRQISTSHPAVSIEVDEMLSLAQVAHLNDRRIDLGLAGANVRLADEHHLDALLIRDDPIECALLDAASPLADRQTLKPQDLAELPFRFMDRETNPGFYDAVMEGLAAIGISPRLVGSYNGPRAMWRAAADLGGWALGTRSLRIRPFPGMVAVPIEGFHIPSGLRLLWRRDEADPAVLAVRDAFRGLQVQSP